jgi:hypothetical protein
MEHEQPLFQACIYTILSPEKLGKAFGDGRGRFHEGKAWITGQVLLRAAKAMGTRLPIVFSSAADCGPLCYWGALTSITIENGGTEFAFDNMQKIREGYYAEDLVKLNGDHIVEDFMTPYAICWTPEFIFCASPISKRKACRHSQRVRKNPSEAHYPIRYETAGPAPARHDEPSAI